MKIPYPISTFQEDSTQISKSIKSIAKPKNVIEPMSLVQFDILRLINVTSTFLPTKTTKTSTPKKNKYSISKKIIILKYV